MANLIITVIAIALVAVAALMGAYYGGSAFANNQSAAAASAVLNIGQQVAGAYAAYRADNNNNLPTSWAQLTAGHYLASLPEAPAVYGGLPANRVDAYEDNAGRWWLIVDVGVPTGTTPDPAAVTCRTIIKTATGTAPAAVGQQGFADSDLAGVTYSGSNGKFGCGIWNGSTVTINGYFSDNPLNATTDDYYFWYSLN